jgi:hypothetical protein
MVNGGIHATERGDKPVTDLVASAEMALETGVMDYAGASMLDVHS